MVVVTLSGFMPQQGYPELKVAVSHESSGSTREVAVSHGGEVDMPWLVSQPKDA